MGGLVGSVTRRVPAREAAGDSCSGVGDCETHGLRRLREIEPDGESRSKTREFRLERAVCLTLPSLISDCARDMLGSKRSSLPPQSLNRNDSSSGDIASYESSREIGPTFAEPGFRRSGQSR